MTMRLRSIRRLALVLASSAAVTVACGDDSGGEEEHGDEPEVCSEISDACHDLDSGSGMAHDCHETAHAGVAADCEAVHDACIAFCTASGTGDSGSGGAGSDSGSTSM